MPRIVAHAFGPPLRVLVHEPADPPVPAADGVLVRMRASAINPSDLIPVTGAYRHRTPLPFVPSYDGVGVVTAVGDAVDPAMVGRRVLPLGSGGAWQTWKTLPAEWCVPVPGDLDDGQAATAYVNPLTARLMVDALAPRPGDRVGVTAAASAIGRMLLRMLARAGARPTAVVRSASSRDALSGEPADVVVDGAPLPALAAGLDAVGGAAGARLAAAIRPGGTLIHYGLLSGRPLTGDLLADAKVTLRLFRLRDWVHGVPRATLRAAMAEAFDDVRTGHAACAVVARYPIAAFREALDHDGRAGRTGKILIEP